MLPEAGALEIVFLAAVALIVVGPKDLPVLLRKIGQFTAKMRGLAAEFRASFDEMARQSELDELRKEVEALRTGQFASGATAELSSHAADINNHLSPNYWDASSQADPVQTFIDPHTGLMMGEEAETAALPPPGSRTPPLPIKTPRKRATISKVADPAPAKSASKPGVAAAKTKIAAAQTASAKASSFKPAPTRTAAKATPAKMAKAAPAAAKPVAKPPTPKAPVKLAKAEPAAGTAPAKRAPKAKQAAQA